MITIDNRENPRDTPRLDLQPLIESMGVSTHLDRLPLGDYCFVGNGPSGEGLSLIGIERKRTKDLLSSMRTGRLLGHQLRNMVNHYDFSYLIVEGVVRRNPDNGLLEQGTRGGWSPVTLGNGQFMYEEYDHFLCSTELSPVKVRRTGGPRESADTLVSLFHYRTNKLWSEHKSWRVIYTPPNPVVVSGELHLVRLWAKDLHGIGYEKSAAVADQFKTGRRMALAPVSEWLLIPGVGETIAERAVREIMGGE